MLPIANRLIFGLEQGDLPMNKTRLKYFDKQNMLNMAISDEPEADSIKLARILLQN